ncbi:MAG: (deoxy)nucleoside triphosphate pyrophosphohydrolase [Oscillatoriales cyanobacterium SM2_2_1]|nr:(deoxy)nucleoside triphosphate pyrophosphohydrolase [Oscillatoriales cyanobacterium SM2_2_1]
MELPTVSVGVAVIWNGKGDRLLISQRLPGSDFAGYWEFPGGKVLPDESIPECIRREVWEELGVEVSVEAPLLALTHAYSHKTVTLSVYHCRLSEGQIPEPRQCQQVCWVALADLEQYGFPAANRAILDRLKRDAGAPCP